VIERHRIDHIAPVTSTPGADTPTGRAAGRRALLNTLYRTGGEGLGRFASLILFAFAGRKLGETGLGAFVFAVAFLGFATVPVDLGLDRYLLRRASNEHSAGDGLFANILGLKLALAIPLFGASIVALNVIGYSHEAQATVWALAPGVFSDSVARTQLAVFQAHERTGPPALADSLQRILSAALGIAALTMGYGVVSVAITYSIGSMTGVLIGFVLMARTIGVPPANVALRSWRTLAVSSFPYATQDVFVTMLYRVDVIILSLMASQAAVGRYGAAYRLFESSMVITYALVGAFTAMYTYLGPDTDPPLRVIFQRSIKLSLALLAPVGVAFLALGGPICELIYGSSFVSAGVPLSILGPCVVLIGVVTLATSLMVSRENPKRIVRLTALMAGANIALNVALIPHYGDAGSAVAMLITEAIFVVFVTRMASRAAGGFRWSPTAAGALAGATGMLVVALLLHGSLWAAVSVGLVVYVVLLASVERLVSPADTRFVVALVRNWLAPRFASRAES
jgi:O-antigen/teichoic acid export membrane protein